jgi:hypothetical protein
MPASPTPTCSSSSTTTTCRSRRRSARSTSTWRGSSRAALQRRAQGRREDPRLFAVAARIRQARRGARQGHADAGHAVRGTRLQLHRPDRRPRPRVAGADAAEPEEAQGTAVPARDHQEGPGLQAGRGRSDPLPRGLEVPARSRHRRRQSGASRPTRRSSATGCATWRPRIRNWSGSRRRCAKARACCASANLPGSLLRRRHRRAARRHLCRRPGLRRACGRCWRSTRPSCSAATISWCTMSRCRTCRWSSRSTAAVWSAPTARRTTAFDLSFLTCIPNMVVMTPSDENECRKMLTTAYQPRRPERRALPARQRPGNGDRQDTVGLPVGKGEIRRRGSGVALLAFGSMLTPGARSGGRARRHGRQHALRQADRPRVDSRPWQRNIPCSSASKRMP